MHRGTVVRSLAGHDNGRLYIVLDFRDGYAFVADGRHHTLEKPKKKKQKHLKDIGDYAELSKYEPLYDAHILKELKCSQKKGGCCLG